jgi:hypothetical protein
MAKKTFKMILIILLICAGLCNGQVKEKRELDPVIKSILLPGWGQKALGRKKRARVYNYFESGLILTIVGSSTFSNITIKNYIAFASEHAAISSSEKNHKYWVDIGNYDSITDYNDEHLRNREMDDLYPDDKKWSWDWDTDANRKAFEKKRISSDQLKLAATFGIGALMVNHIVSAIDVLYLKRVIADGELSVKPYQDLEIGSLGYALTLEF